MNLSAKFYKEHLGVDEEQAVRISWFMRFAHTDKVVNRASPWGCGEMARVYFFLRSQNRMEAVQGLRAAYYDAGLDDLIIDREVALSVHRVLLRTLLTSHQKTLFSGAKTKESIASMMERFDAEKTARD